MSKNTHSKQILTEKDKLQMVITIFEENKNAFKIKKPKKNKDNPAMNLPTRVTDKNGTIIGYPIVLDDGKVTLSPTPPNTDLFDSSYFRDFAIGKVIGKGTFGTVKNAITASPNDDVCLKRIRLDTRSSLENIEEEWAIHRELGQTAGEMMVLNNKVYLPLRNLGATLGKNYAPTVEGRISQSINVLLAVDELHNGEHTHYAHRDIKPENILVDSTGKITLIDFTFTTSEINSPVGGCGTIMYYPVNYSQLNHPINHDSIKAYLKIQGPVDISAVDADKISALRTVFHPLSDVLSILKRDDFEKFPEPIKILINTYTTNSFIGSKNKDLSEKMIASALAYYQLTTEITKEEVTCLRQTPAFQETIISTMKMTDPIEKKEAIARLKNDMQYHIKNAPPSPTSSQGATDSTNISLRASPIEQTNEDRVHIKNTLDNCETAVLDRIKTLDKKPLLARFKAFINPPKELTQLKEILTDIHQLQKDLYRTNANLEEIADFTTNIIIQLAELPSPNPTTTAKERLNELKNPPEDDTNTHTLR